MPPQKKKVTKTKKIETEEDISIEDIEENIDYIEIGKDDKRFPPKDDINYFSWWDEYYEFIRKGMTLGIHRDLALLFMHYGGHEYACYNKAVYVFHEETALWEEKDEGSLFQARIAGDIIKQYLTLRNNFMYEYVSYSKNDKMVAETARKEIIKFNNIINKLGNTSFQKNIWLQILESIQENSREFKEKLNANKYLLPVMGNKVIDLKTGLCEERTREHYFTYQIPTKWEEYTEENMKDAKQFIDQIFMMPDKNIDDSPLEGNIEILKKEYEDFIYRHLGYMLLPYNASKLMFMWIGDGDNGKSTLTDLLTNIFNSGEDAGSGLVHSDGRLFMNLKDSSAGAPSPHMAILRGKRILFACDIEPAAELNERFIKCTTGGDKEYFRKLHSNKFEMLTPEFTPILISNGFPDISNVEAMWNRLVIIYFHTKFVNNPDQKDRFQVKRCGKIKLKIKDEGFKSAFLKIMVSQALEIYNNEDLSGNIGKIPNVLTKAKSDKKEEMNIYMSFIKDCLIITPNKDDTIEATPLYRLFNEWFEEYGNDETISNSKFGKEIKKYLKSFKKQKVVYQYIKIREDFKSDNNFNKILNRHDSPI